MWNKNLLVRGRMLFQDLIKKAYNQIISNTNLRLSEDGRSTTVKPMCAFTYLRMGQQLFQPENWSSFVSFVRKLAQGQGTLNS